MADDPKNEVIEGHDRRGFLKTAVGVTAVVAARPLEAQGTEPGTPSGPRKPGRLPANTPITKLGFSAAEIAQMTPAVQKLTKGDLMELQQWQASGDTKDAPLHLSLQDLNSLQTVFQSMDARQHQDLAASSVSCCCCSCCPCCSCCAAADIA